MSYGTSIVSEQKIKQETAQAKGGTVSDKGETKPTEEFETMEKDANNDQRQKRQILVREPKP